MLSLQRMRSRLPLAVFILLLIFVVIAMGFACLCMTDHPAQTVERAVGAVAAAPALIEIWSFVVANMLLAVSIIYLRRERPARSPTLSPPLLL